MSRRSTAWAIGLVSVLGIAWAIHSLDLLALLRRMHGQ